MTNANRITAKLAEYETAKTTYSANPTSEGWRTVNAIHNDLIPFAKTAPITRAEYEALLVGHSLNDDDAIYRTLTTWWTGDDHLLWCLAHFARQAALNNERGQYVAPTAEMLGLELVTDGLPEGFREYHKGAE